MGTSSGQPQTARKGVWLCIAGALIFLISLTMVWYVWTYEPARDVSPPVAPGNPRPTSAEAPDVTNEVEGHSLVPLGGLLAFVLFAGIAAWMASERIPTLRQRINAAPSWAPFVLVAYCVISFINAWRNYSHASGARFRPEWASGFWLAVFGSLLLLVGGYRYWKSKP